MTTAKEFEYRLEVLATSVRDLLCLYRDGTIKLTNQSRGHLASVLWSAEELQDLHRRRDLDIGPDYGKAFVCRICDQQFGVRVVHCDRCGWHRRDDQPACVWSQDPKPRSS